MSDLDDAKAEVLKCARAWGHYINLRAKIHKKPPNLTEQALLDAVVELGLAEAQAAPEAKALKTQKKKATKPPDEGEPGVLTCQQCRESYLEAASVAETFRRFCGRSCEDQYDRELSGEDQDDGDEE